jgi:hypothetical protein
LHEIMGQIPHVSQFIGGIPSEATGKLPSVAVDSVPQVQEKKTAASSVAEEKNGNSVFPQKREGEFIEDALRAQGNQASEGEQQAKAADAPQATPAIRNYIALVETASKMLWEVRAGGTLEVLPPLEEKSELVKDMLAELKQTANAAFADCGELTEALSLEGETQRQLQAKPTKMKKNKEPTSVLQVNRPPISRVKPGKAPTNHDERVGELLRAGWRYDDILPALEASKDEGGNENLDAAQDYLENLRQWRLRSANTQVVSKAAGGKEETKDRIAANSELAQYIAVNPDHIDVCLYLLDVHEMNSRSHDADHFRTAANLMAKVKQDPVA